MVSQAASEPQDLSKRTKIHILQFKIAQNSTTNAVFETSGLLLRHIYHCDQIFAVWKLNLCILPMISAPSTPRKMIFKKSRTHSIQNELNEKIFKYSSGAVKLLVYKIFFVETKRRLYCAADTTFWGKGGVIMPNWSAPQAEKIGIWVFISRNPVTRSGPGAQKILF